MGDLITMTKPAVPRRVAAPTGGAEILFFTGVRYVRMDDGVATPDLYAAKAKEQKASSALRPDQQV